MSYATPQIAPLRVFVDAVAADFKARGISAKVDAGRKALTRQDNQGSGTANRVVFFHGDDGGGSGQWLSNFGNANENPRPVAGVNFVIGFSVWASAKDPSDDVASGDLAWWLFQEMVASVHAVASGAYVPTGSLKRSVTPAEVVHGFELRGALLLNIALHAPENVVRTPEPDIEERSFT